MSQKRRMKERRRTRADDAQKGDPAPFVRRNSGGSIAMDGLDPRPGLILTYGSAPMV